jgi:DNA-binding transcriptional LysR family regulator
VQIGHNRILLDLVTPKTVRLITRHKFCAADRFGRVGSVNLRDLHSAVVLQPRCQVALGAYHDDDARWMRSVAPHATIAARSEHWQGVMLAVKAGAGLAAMPHWQGDAERELVRVIENIGLVLPYYLLMHRDLQHTPRVRAFAEFVASEIKSFRARVEWK